MIVKSLRLENIRSYGDRDLVIQFELGVTLFEGDMHAGKSTLLYAIEFALFGLGELKGSFLLRNGCQRGEVTLVFEECGQVYEIHRSLIKKGNSVRQDDCHLRGPSGKQFMAPTDLKEKILQILGFNEPVNPKAQSVIYRYAIFTPQEQMKEVMNKDPDSRLQTLRKAFRIEDYKIATENCCLLLKRINNKLLFLEGQTKDHDNLKKELETTTKEIEDNGRLLASLKNKESLITKNVKELELERAELNKERERLIRIEDKIPIYTKQVKDKEEEIIENNQEIFRNKNKLSEIRTQIMSLNKVRNRTNLSLDELEAQTVELVRRIEQLQSYKQLATQAGSHIPLHQNALNKLSYEIGIKLDEKMNKENMVKELENKVTKLKEIKRPTEKSVSGLQEERLELEHAELEVTKQISRLDERVSNFDLLVKDGKCPICERSIDSEGFVSKSLHLKNEKEKLGELYDSIASRVIGLDNLKEKLIKFNELDTERNDLGVELRQINQDITSLSLYIKERKKEEKYLKNEIRKAVKEASKEKAIQGEIDRLSKKRIQIVKLTEALKEYQQAQKELGRLATDENEHDMAVKRLIDVVRRLEGDKEITKESIENAKNEIRPLIPIQKKLESLELDLDQIKNEAQLFGNKISSTKTRLELSTAKRKQLEGHIAAKEKVLETIRLLSEHKIWLVDYFSVAVSNIEKHVLESLRRHFNNQFQRWFEILVEDQALRVTVDENFTAQMSREGFDQDYFQLSGGERTSIALAYRLALNLIVQEVSAGGSSNLLILDEPTDGFSKQQLYKLRDVFRELRCPQIIIVSHERELEGFADNIVNIQNKDGFSYICNLRK